MKIRRVVAAVTLVLVFGLVGCSSPAARAPAPQVATRPSQSAKTPVAGVPIVIAALKRPLGDPDTWPPVGSVLPASAYEPVVTPDHVAGVSWVTGIVNGVNTPELSLKFDPVGTKEFADWTSANVGKQGVVLLDGKILALPVIAEGIKSGSMVLSTPKPESMRSVLASYGLSVP